MDTRVVAPEIELTTEHDTLRKHLTALRKLVTVLNYPESLGPELKRGWPELQLILRGVHSYLKTGLPEHHRREELAFRTALGELAEPLLEEHAALESLADALLRLTAGWLSQRTPPSRAEILDFSGLANELEHHLARHSRLEDERLIPRMPRVPREREAG